MKTMNELETQYGYCLNEPNTDIEDIIDWEIGITRYVGFSSSCYMFYAWMIENRYFTESSE